jgi:hypothetical protein
VLGKASAYMRERRNFESKEFGLYSEEAKECSNLGSCFKNEHEFGTNLKLNICKT